MIAVVVLFLFLCFGGGIGLVVLGLGVWRMADGIEDRVFSTLIVSFGVLLFLTPVAVYLSPRDDRPCVRYETTYQFNAATKTSMPVRYCAQYGEWIEEKPGN